jgi:probable F420-dependent oxidoreductase
MSANGRRYWGFVSPLQGGLLAAHAQMLDAAAVEGAFAPQVYGPPFLPLAAAAAVTKRIRLASGIAIAFTRSPFETAMAAIDLDRLSGGRFTLGLGCSARSWMEGFFGMPCDKPLARMREVVEIIRLVVAEAHTGRLTRYDGVHYSHDFGELQPPAPPVRTELPIWIAALRAPLVSLAAEIGDGVMGHPIWSVAWATTEMPAAIERGLERAGRDRAEIEVNLWPWTAIAEDRHKAIDDSRPTVAFYAAIPQYEHYFAAHGFGEETLRIRSAVSEGTLSDGARLVPDEMVETFVACGSPDEVRVRIEPLWQVADSLCPAPPSYGLPPEKVFAYTAAIAQTFYGGDG